MKPLAAEKRNIWVVISEISPEMVAKATWCTGGQGSQPNGSCRPVGYGPLPMVAGFVKKLTMLEVGDPPSFRTAKEAVFNPDWFVSPIQDKTEGGRPTLVNIRHEVLVERPPILLVPGDID